MSSPSPLPAGAPIPSMHDASVYKLYKRRFAGLVAIVRHFRGVLRLEPCRRTEGPADLLLSCPPSAL